MILFSTRDGDNFDIVLRTGSSPTETNRSLVIIQRFDDLKSQMLKDKWGYTILEKPHDEVVVEVYIPSDALVARYDMNIERNDKTVFKMEKKLTILFNPWCESK